MIIILKTLIVSGIVGGIITYLHAHFYHHSSVCHRCGGKGFVNGSICPDCGGDGNYRAGKDKKEKHYDFGDEDSPTDPNDRIDIDA